MTTFRLGLLERTRRAVFHFILTPICRSALVAAKHRSCTSISHTPTLEKDPGALLGSTSDPLYSYCLGANIRGALPINKTGLIEPRVRSDYGAGSKKPIAFPTKFYRFSSTLQMADDLVHYHHQSCMSHVDNKFRCDVGQLSAHFLHFISIASQVLNTGHILH